ncbi:DUF2167 domain-containing protein [Pararhizobium sp.]|uniref:DUF2167 domain-containing protein n=1 Tax=Pararhizobium sp. TaxID=1977563 RepID=UPI002726163C|nr:DUF2167 domain-containing protein [Pararhizobium sp.]MDO9415874.1 DUF2167 domain-containing protein [Pararhizobium sp.]
MTRYILPALLLALLSTTAEAKTYAEMFGPVPPLLDGLTKAKLESMDFKQGEIALPGAKAKLTIPAGFYYLDKADTRKVLVEMWGNPLTIQDGSLGMIFPVKYTPQAPQSWSAVIDYLDEGYVSDADAESTDFNDLLVQLKKASQEQNAERKTYGQDPVTLVGWASAPLYDKANHTLHWARDLIFGNDPNGPHTLNYSVRMLGREGILQLNFVAGLNQLQEIKDSIPAVTKLAAFDSGLTYTDFKDGDKMAAYGMAGLIAAGAGAKIATKLGLIALALAFLKKGGFVLALVAGGGLLSGIKRMFQRKAPPAA